MVKKAAPSKRPGVLIKRDQIWCGKVVQQQRARIEREILARLHRDNDPRALARELISTGKLRTTPSYLAQLRLFLSLLQALELHGQSAGESAGESAGLSDTEVLLCYRRARSILIKHGVTPRRSRLSFLWRDLHQAMGRIHARDGRMWLAAWEQALGRHISGQSPEATEYEGVVRASYLALEVERVQEAIAQLLQAELPGTPRPTLNRLRIARARILRLSGATAAAVELVRRIGMELADVPHTDLLVELQWERAALASLRQQSLDPLVALIRRDRTCRQPEQLLALRLWTLAAKSKQWIGATPKAASLRRAGGRRRIDRTLLRCAEQIDRCYGGRTPLASRLQALGQALEEVEQIQDVEHRLLTWAAAGRWLVRSRKTQLADLVFARYHTLSLSLSCGLTKDVLQLAGDVRAIPEVEPELWDRLRFGQQREPPRSRLGRGLHLSRLARDLARSRIHQITARLVGAEAAPRSEELLEYAEILTHYLGEMKGLVMKVGQIMSFYGFDIPAEIQEMLRTLQDTSTPISSGPIIEVIEEDFGRPLSSLFSRFEEHPFATGSIGQVHLAELVGGQRVAVKIQYPGIEESIRNDLRSLALTAPVLRRILPRWDIDGIFDELSRHVLAECDYRQETEHQELFRQMFEGDRQIEIPRVVRTHCSRRVMTSELVEGLSFREFCGRADQEERNRAGELLSRFVLRTIISERYFNTDIHPGNFLFHDGKLFVVDFGNVRRWSGDQGIGFRLMLQAILSHDLARFRSAFLSLGIVTEQDELEVESAFDLIATRLLCCVTEDRGRRFDRDAVRRDIELWFLNHSEARKAVLPPECLLALRAYWGSFAIMAELGAENNWRRFALNILKDYPLHG